MKHEKQDAFDATNGKRCTYYWGVVWSLLQRSILGQLLKRCRIQNGESCFRFRSCQKSVNCISIRCAMIKTPNIVDKVKRAKGHC